MQKSADLFFRLTFPCIWIYYSSLINKKMRNKNIKNYLKFFASLVKDINNPNEEKWFSDYRESNASSGIVNYLNMRLSELLTDIKNKKISPREMTVGDAAIFKKVLNCRSLDQELLDEISHQLYGGDERARNF